MPARYLSVKNYERYQHYTQRRPPWVKLYWTLLDDEKFVRLSLANRGLYCHFILLASRYANHIPYDLDHIQMMLRLSEKPDVTLLINAGFLLASRYKRASNTLGLDEDDARPLVQRTEDREQRTEEEQTIAVFEQFWNAYPKRNGKRVGRQKTLGLFLKLTPEDRPITIQAAINYSRSERVLSGYSKDPERFLKDEFWRDWVEPESSKTDHAREAFLKATT